jgi:hypothetical protein
MDFLNFFFNILQSTFFQITGMGRRRTALVLAIFLIIAGLLITMENFSMLKGVTFHWPVLLTIFGTGFIMLFFERNRNDPVLMWLGTFQIVLSFLFYYLNATSWKNLVSLWPVFLGTVGISFLTVAIFSRKMMFVYIAGSFLGLFIIFTLVFSISSKLWPLSFVVFGLSLIIIEQINSKINP